MSAPFLIKASLPLLAAALLGACSREADDTVPSNESPSGVRQETAAIDEAEWRRMQIDGQSALVFGEDGKPPLAALRCDPQLESLFIDRMMVDTQRRADRMMLRVEDRRRTLPIVWNASSPPTASSMLTLEDTLTDSLTRLSGQIEIAVGEDALALPTDRRIGTLVEECRQAQLR